MDTPLENYMIRRLRENIETDWQDLEFDALQEFPTASDDDIREARQTAEKRLGIN